MDRRSFLVGTAASTLLSSVALPYTALRPGPLSVTLPSSAAVPLGTSFTIKSLADSTFVLYAGDRKIELGKAQAITVQNREGNWR